MWIRQFSDLGLEETVALALESQRLDLTPSSTAD